MTHPRIHAAADPAKPAVIMSDGSATLTYGQLEDRADRGAHLLRARGIVRGDTVAFWLGNDPGVFEFYWAAQRCGLYITPVATALTGEEASYIVANSGAKLVVVSPEISALATLDAPAGVEILTLDEWRYQCNRQPAEPIGDERPGFHMVYSSGTTGRPKGVRLPLPEGGVTDLSILAAKARDGYGLRSEDVYLSPAPLYHTAPLVFTTNCHRLGATVVQMPRFDPEAALAAIECYKVTITQMVPTMFVRMLKLPAEVRARFDLSSLRTVIHAAAPCPVPVKHQMIEWLGPILFEYYGGSEGNGSTGITSEEWLRKPGSVGRASWGTLHICDEEGIELPAGEQGTVYFEGGWDFRYLGDEAKTRDSRNPLHPTWSALGDVGYVDADGYLFLTDRKSYMIISGGVNIYPQEVENLLITHPKVADAAVIGAPDPDMGEKVVAVVQPLDMAQAGPELAEELRAYLAPQLSRLKMPKQIDFMEQLPREATGKLYKRHLRDAYWAAAARETA